MQWLNPQKHRIFRNQLVEIRMMKILRQIQQIIMSTDGRNMPLKSEHISSRKFLHAYNRDKEEKEKTSRKADGQATRALDPTSYTT